MGEKRIGWMDNARALAILCVVLTHSVESNYYYVLTGSLDACFSSWLFDMYPQYWTASIGGTAI